MSGENPERGIILGSSSETIFIITSNEEVIMRQNDKTRNLAMGDCLHILSTSTTNWRNPAGFREIKRVVENFEKVPAFVEWKYQNNRKGIIIMADIIDVRMRPIPGTDRIVRCFRTDFIEEIYDSEYSLTGMYSERELMKMKAVMMRTNGASRSAFFWTLIEIFRNPDEKKNAPSNRIFCNGIALEMQRDQSKNGRNDIYFWVPYKREQVLFMEEMRGNIPKIKYSGTWVSFSLNSSYRMDEFSDVQFVNDVFPTRFFANRCEVKVSVNFDKNTWKQGCYPEMMSQQCAGIVVDLTGTLEKYGMLKSFHGEAWVHYFPHERGIRFVLSEKQEHWDEEAENDVFRSRGRSRTPRNNGNYGNSTDLNRRERSRPSREEEFEDSDLRKSRSVSRKPSHQPAEENDSDDSWDQEANRRSRIREYSRPPMRSPERSNYRDNFDRRRERSRPREDFDIVDQRNREYERRSRETSRPPMKHENEREKSRPREDFDIVDQRNREYERRSRETSRPPSRKRDDTSSIPSTSRSYNDDLSKVQTNLKKLKTRYEYLTANNMPIPEKLREDLGNAIAEEIRLKKNNQDLDDRKSGSSRVEVNEEDLQKYKELVVMFREMLSSQEVCEEMRRFDEIAMDNINQLLFDL